MAAARQRKYNKPVHTGLIPPFIDRKWNLKVAVCVVRPPKLSPDFPECVIAHRRLKEEIAEAFEIPSEHDMTMKRHAALRKALELRAKGEEVKGYTAYELTGYELQAYDDRVKLEEAERDAYTPADRVTEDDRQNVETSLNRFLHRHLYLVVRNKSEETGWHFPLLTVDGTTALREVSACISTFALAL